MKKKVEIKDLNKEVTLSEDEIKQVKGGIARKGNIGSTEVESKFITVDPKTGGGSGWKG